MRKLHREEVHDDYGDDGNDYNNDLRDQSSDAHVPLAHLLLYCFASDKKCWPWRTTTTAETATATTTTPTTMTNGRI